MIKLASESMDTVEKRQGLPSKEAKESHMAHEALQSLSCDTSTIQTTSEPFADATKTYHGGKGPQLLDVELKTQGSTRTRAHRKIRVASDGLSRNLACFLSKPRALLRHDR